MASTEPKIPLDQVDLPVQKDGVQVMDVDHVDKVAHMDASMLVVVALCQS